MASLEQFSRQIRADGRRVVSAAVDTVRVTALAADSLVVLATPVETGRARSNWLPGVNRPNRSTAPAEDRSGQSAINQARGAFAALGPGDSAWISNNLPYINRLNDGHSPQAAAGYVDRAVRIAAESVEKAFSLGR